MDVIEYDKLTERRDELVDLKKRGNMPKRYSIMIDKELDMVREQIKLSHREQYTK